MESTINERLLEFLKQKKIVVLEEAEDYVRIYVENPNQYLIDNLKVLFGKNVIVEKDNNNVDISFDIQFSKLPNIEKLLNKKNVEELASEAPIVKLLNDILDLAISKSATDIHIEPYENHLEVKFRIDGVLRNFNKFPKYLHPAILSRIKILSKLDIAEKRLPQDGKFIYRKDNEEYDIRVSTLPTIYGETAVLRILRKGKIEFSLDSLGFSRTQIDLLRDFIKHSYGMILVTGPTGSGKTTTLYALLKEVNDGERKIITVEDPVEYTVPGIVQIQVNSRVGLTFSKALRTILRQDPDVIMIGEIRDLETAEIAVRAALTGHLVLATLHTNDAISAFTRLIDMGVEEFLLASSVVGVISQRLVRKICENCKVAYEPSFAEKKLYERVSLSPPKKLYKGKGCDNCEGTGYKGRTVIAELLKVDDDIRTAISQKLSTKELKSIAKQKGFKSLLQDGLEKATKGITTLSEVLRVYNL